ncbi:MAG: DNA alkylation repair protein [Gammaproteobacteria bacterium]|nr:DNA alkylation repair protein [Gammaproteobacteria bacterium]
MSAKEISLTLKALADSEIAKHSQRFFKTGKGEYGEGDKFLGIRVPVLRQHAKRFESASLNEIQNILKSPYHEERLCALLMLVRKFKKGDAKEQKAIYTLYMKGIQYINNWDLVDSSAHQIVGSFLETRSRRPIYKLAKSKNLWERRIAIMSTFHWIKNNNFDEALVISRLLLDDSEDLIHKAVGWMLREIGNRNLSMEKSFLKQHYKRMPRTMLRYAIEKFPEEERIKYLSGNA